MYVSRTSNTKHYFVTSFQIAYLLLLKFKMHLKMETHMATNMQQSFDYTYQIGVTQNLSSNTIKIIHHNCCTIKSWKYCHTLQSTLQNARTCGCKAANMMKHIEWTHFIAKCFDRLFKQFSANAKLVPNVISQRLVQKRKTAVSINSVI